MEILVLWQSGCLGKGSWWRWWWRGLNFMPNEAVWRCPQGGQIFHTEAPFGWDLAFWVNPAEPYFF